MKRLVSTIFVFSTLLGSLGTVKANDNYQNALSVAQSHIYTSGDLWEEAEIINYELLYDINMEEYGYVFEVDNQEDEGYIIVVEDINGNYYMNEASPNGESPYKNLDEEINVYYSAMNYYSVDEVATLSGELKFVDLTSGKEYTYSDFKPFEKVEASISNSVRSTSNRVWLPEYFLDTFELVSQNDDYSCIPCSSAMAVKYLHNMGFLTLTSSMRNISTIKSELIDLMNAQPGSYVNPSNAINGIEEFGDLYSSEPLTFGYSESVTTSKYNQLTGEIDDGYPAIIVYKPGVLDYVNDLHANTLVGYDASKNTLLSYDPINERDFEVAWNSSNISSHFIIYVG